MTLRNILMFIAAILFLLAAANLNSPRVNLQALGLFFMAISLIVP